MVGKTAIWNSISLILPLGTCLFFFIQDKTSSGGPGQLGAFVAALVVCFCVAVFGLIAAVVSLIRGERYLGMTMLAIAVNIAVLVRAYTIAIPAK